MMAMTGSLNMDSAAQAESGNPGLFPHRHPGETWKFWPPVSIGWCGRGVALPGLGVIAFCGKGGGRVETVTPYRGYMGMFSSSGGGG